MVSTASLCPSDSSSGQKFLCSLGRVWRETPRFTRSHLSKLRGFIRLRHRSPQEAAFVSQRENRGARNVCQTSANECSGSEQRSAIKSSGNKLGFRFPILDKISVKQKLKPSLKKVEKSVLDPNKVTADLGVPQDCAGPSSETAFEKRERSLGRKSLTQSSKLNLDRRGLERKNKIGSVPAQAQAQPSTSTSQETSGSCTTNKLSGLSLLRHKRASFSSRGKSFCSIQHLNMKDSHEEMEDTKDGTQLEKESLPPNVSTFPSTLGQSHRSGEVSLAQGERQTLAEGADDKTVSSKRGKSSHWLLRKKKLKVTAAEPQQRKSRDSDKLHAPDGNYIEDAEPSEFESRPTNSSIPKMHSNASSTDRASAHYHCREWRSDEHSRKRYGGSVTSSMSTVPIPLLHSALNRQGSLAQSAHRPASSTNRSAATVSPQTLNLDGSSKFSMHAPLCFLRNRDCLSTPGSSDVPPPLHSIPEDSSLLEASIRDSLNTSSPSGASHDGESLQNSLSSLSLDSSSPSLFQTRFAPDLQAASALYDQLPFALPAALALQNLSSTVSNTTASQSASTEEVKKPQADQEKLKQLQESVLAEDSGEEGDQCRICQIAGGSPTNPLLEPCGCVGSLQFVHQKCLKKWLEAKIKSGADLGAIETCELCKQSLTIDLDDFNVNEYYRNHHYSQAQNELTNLYLVLLFMFGNS
ncbi:probable E3 ubiquitin-protein ligase MARCHF10 isoform X2 [Struthio camelus]|uniref:probable E3 ubiquitin-protein ligase MARCHF10 isoform X2 n=1 Tax=Struthio camelus TaxID=8801 RepID=UPI00360427F3